MHISILPRNINAKKFLINKIISSLSLRITHMCVGLQYCGWCVEVIQPWGYCWAGNNGKNFSWFLNDCSDCLLYLLQFWFKPRGTYENCKTAFLISLVNWKFMPWCTIFLGHPLRVYNIFLTGHFEQDRMHLLFYSQALFELISHPFVTCAFAGCQ